MSFETAAANIKKSAERSVKMTDDELLKVYGLYKQGTVGDNNTDKPSFIQLKEKAKWGAWNDNKGKSKEAAQQEYTALAKQLLIKYKCEDLAQF